MRIAGLVGVVAVWLAGAASGADLRGHGGPVRALAVGEAARAVTGSFDTTAILWDLDAGAARSVMRLHEGGVNAVELLPGGRIATGGQDGRIGLWDAEGGAPEAIIDAHDGPVSDLAVSQDGTSLAASGWDAQVTLTDLRGGVVEGSRGPRVLEGSRGPLNAVAFLEGGGIAAGGHSGALLVWAAVDAAPVVVQLAAPINALAPLRGGGLRVAGADGHLREIDAAGAVRADVEVALSPLVSLAVSRDGGMVAVGGIDGVVTLIEGGAVLRRIQVGDGPVWAIGFGATGETLLAGGSGNLVREWDVATGRALNPGSGASETAVLGDSRGAEVYRACIACHTLDPDDANRAGPTLHGIFGRRIASARGYDYSEALRGMDIVWTPATVAQLFEVGPHAYTPGTKMPEQRIVNESDRAALIEFLEARTR